MALSAGFSRVNITPHNGVAIEGYFIPRRVDGVLDDLEINALALSDGDKTVLVMCSDICLINQEYSDIFRGLIAAETNLPLDAIFMTVTHTHTSPCVGKVYTGSIELNEDDDAYLAKFKVWVVEAAKAAIADLKPARKGWRVGNAPGISFSRRYRMKDGSVRTNPGLGNPDVLEPIGEMDDRVSVLRFDQEDGNSIVLVNYANHPDSIGGCKASADWPGVVRRTVEASIPGTKCIFLNGSEGDVGANNVFAKDGDLNGLTKDFDDVLRGIEHTKHMGRTIAGAVLQVYGKVNFTENNTINYKECVFEIPANVPDASEMELAHKYNALHKEGKDCEIPYEGMMLTTVVAESERMVKLENGPESFPMKFIGLSIGDVALMGIPGEIFTKAGMDIKDTEGYKLVIPVSNVNGAEGYFPTMNAYEEGGYEARSSYFKKGAAEYIVQKSKELLGELS